MPNGQSTRRIVPALPGVSSSAVLDTLYAGREPARQPARATSSSQKHKEMVPDAIWGQFNNYRSNGLVGSAFAHVIALGLILGGAAFGDHAVKQVQQHETVTLIAPSPDSYALPVAKKVLSGGGGGGDHDHLPATKGKLPKLEALPVTPPAIIVRNEHPKLVAQPAVAVPPQVRLAENHMPNLGDPSAAPLPSAPPSNGIGSGGGIGSGSHGGVGAGNGAGVGIGSGGGMGGGVFKVGGGISAPQAISTPDPEYTEAARNAKTQGTCILWLIVDDQGHPRDIRVVRGLGFGLDEKAIDAVRQWRFAPAQKDGHPVNVQISVEVGFRLY